MRLKLFILGICFLFAFTIYFGLTLHYSNFVMTMFFYKNERKFHELVEMFQKDSQIARVIGNSVSPSDTSKYPRPTNEQLISNTRHQSYLELLRQIANVGSIRRDYENKDLIYISVSYVSEEPDENGQYFTSTKGYAFCPNEPKDKYGYTYTHIGGNWYIFYEEGYGKPE